MSGRLDPEPVPRRDFLGWAGLLSSGLAVFGSILGMARLPKPRVLPEGTSRFRVGNPAAFPPGTVKLIPEQNVRIVATEEGVAAMSLVCTHLGCIVSETQDGFLCPCHGSQFTHEGQVSGGPAPRPLPWLAVAQAADGTLIVDAKQEVPPGQFYKA